MKVWVVTDTRHNTCGVYAEGCWNDIVWAYNEGNFDTIITISDSYRQTEYYYFTLMDVIES